MAKKTLEDINAQIAALLEKASALKAQARDGVIATMKEQIEEFDITPRELFSDTARGAAGRAKANAGKKEAKAEKPAKKRTMPKGLKKRVFTQDDRIRLVSEWDALQQAGMGATKAAQQLGVAFASLQAWKQALGG